jgi:hypothetical protein
VYICFFLSFYRVLSSQDGKTALTHAKQNGKHDIARLIEVYFFYTMFNSSVSLTRVAHSFVFFLITCTELGITLFVFLFVFCLWYDIIVKNLYAFTRQSKNVDIFPCRMLHVLPLSVLALYLYQSFSLYDSD